jgi:hypothetical protein
MAELKTKQTDADVNKFLDSVPDERKREDSHTIINLMSEITGEQPKLWGPSIIGFGSYHYKYDSGHEGDSMLTGFSPRKQAISVYLMAGGVMAENHEYGKKLGSLGKYKMGKGCLYINKLDDVNIDRLKELIEMSVDYLRKKYPEKV